MLELVRDGKAGLGFIETPHLPSDLVTEHVRDDELLVVTAPGHPWAGRRRPLGLAEIAATPLVMREAGSGTRDTLTDHLAAQDPPLRPRIAMELGTSAAVRSAIAAGVGPGVLSRLAVRDDLVLGRLVAVEVAGPPLTRQLTAVWKPDDPLPPEGQRLLAVATAAPVAAVDAAGLSRRYYRHWNSTHILVARPEPARGYASIARPYQSDALRTPGRVKK